MYFFKKKTKRNQVNKAKLVNPLLGECHSDFWATYIKSLYEESSGPIIE